MKSKVVYLEIETGGGKIKLTLEDAKELYNLLHGLFGDKVIINYPATNPFKVVEPARYPYIGDPMPCPTYPTITWRVSNV